MNPSMIARRAGPPDPRRSLGPLGRPNLQRGVTLIELLIALAITMIMMTAVVTLFANLAATVADSRALIEISERLRGARNRLQLDLVGHTATTIPPLRPEDGEGYLEIVEGPNSDSASGATAVTNPLNGNYLTSYYSFAPTSLTASTPPGSLPAIIPPYPTAYPTLNSIMGDSDDILALTVRSQGDPFVGNMNGVMVESPLAEVIWFALPNGRTLPTADPNRPVQLYTLYRRVLLISPTYFNTNYGLLAGVGNAAVKAPLLQTTGVTGIGNGLPYDLSMYTPLNTDYSVLTTTNANAARALPNTLETLTQRENRYLHNIPSTMTGLTPVWNPTGGFPFTIANQTLATPYLNLANSVLTNTRLGEDVILTDVLAFDIRVFDPMAPVLQSANGDALVPSDPGYMATYTAGGATVLGYGAYVDPGYVNTFTWGAPTNPPASYFSDYPNAAYKRILGAGTNLTGPGSSFKTALSFLPQTVDTFSLGYEANNYDDDNNGIIDQGTNGVDDDTKMGATTSEPDGVVDNVPQITAPYFYESGSGAAAATNAPSSTVTQPPNSTGVLYASERETMAPYPFPLRAVQIMIRVYEPDTRQVRQVTVTQDFLPD